jgi:hypothetical protein
MRADLLTVHMEHGLPLLAGLDLGALMGAQDRLAKGDQAAIADVLGALGTAGNLRTIRKLSAVVNATAEELLAAELDPKKLATMEGAAALKPFGETFRDALGFFSAWAASLGSPLGSSETEEGKGTTLAPPMLAGSLSADS